MIVHGYEGVQTVHFSRHKKNRAGVGSSQKTGKVQSNTHLNVPEIAEP